jgi:hypothetical protein
LGNSGYVEIPGYVGSSGYVEIPGYVGSSGYVEELRLRVGFPTPSSTVNFSPLNFVMMPAKREGPSTSSGQALRFAQDDVEMKKAALGAAFVFGAGSGDSG